MLIRLLAPVALCLVGAVGVTSVPRITSPSAAARLLLATLVATVLGLISALVLAVAAGTAAIAARRGLLGWCPVRGSAAVAVPAALVGGLALLALGAGTVRGLRHWWRVRGQRRALGPVTGVEVVPLGGPVAYAVFGRPGGIVVGRELLGALAPAERAAVLAHEQAHLDLRHDRYLGLSGLLSAAVPPLEPLARRIRYHTERWADEVAARRVGSRRVVARALTKAALLGTPDPPSPPAAGLTGSGVAERVRAMLHEPARGSGPEAVLGVLGAATAAVGAAVQAHHLVAFVQHACLG